jgi:tyrosinase
MSKQVIFAIDGLISSRLVTSFVMFRGTQALRPTAVIVAIIALIVSVAVVATPALSVLRGDAHTTVRKNVKNLTPAEKREFVAAILASKATPAPGNPRISYYDQFVAWHRQAFRCSVAWAQKRNWAGAAHASPTFLPWHRQYLILFEQMLREVSGNPRLMLPYWDWTDPESTAAVFADDFMGGNGNPEQSYAVTTGPFRKGKWKITIQDAKPQLAGLTRPKPHLVRNFGAYRDKGISLPTKQQVRETLDVHDYDHRPFNARAPLNESFRNALEGWREVKRAACEKGWVFQSSNPEIESSMHNAVHVYVGGVWRERGKTSMGTMVYATSPNDPVFFVHHANVDRIWASWEITSRAHYQPQRGAPNGFNGNSTMWPWYDRTINSWFGTERNGYRYASLPGLS